MASQKSYTDSSRFQINLYIALKNIVKITLENWRLINEADNGTCKVTARTQFSSQRRKSRKRSAVFILCHNITIKI